MSIIKNFEIIQHTIPDVVKLVVVSKTQEASKILEIYHKGHRIFGENKVQELLLKYEQLPKDIDWHFIGHLQSNKVKAIAPFIKLIHSVDSHNLLMEINKEAAKAQRVIDCLLEFHIAKEDSKFGLNLQQAETLVKHYLSLNNAHVRLIGVMGMATFTDDVEQIKNEFINLRNFYNKLKIEYFANDDKFKEISMGMTDDYAIAIEQGSTMLRIGSAIFGSRL